MKLHSLLKVMQQCLLFTAFTAVCLVQSAKAQTPGEWYYNESFGFLYPYDSLWHYSNSLGDHVAIFPADDGAGVYYFYTDVLGWGYISNTVSPWIYFYGTNGTGDVPFDAGWYYSFGIQGGGSSPDSYYSDNEQATTQSGLRIQFVNGTLDSLDSHYEVPSENIWITPYSPNAIDVKGMTLGQSVKLSDLIKNNPQGILASSLNGVRFYISYDDLNGKLEDSGTSRTAGTGALGTKEGDFDPFKNDGGSDNSPRADKIEVSYLTSVKDGVTSIVGAANLTNVDYYGLPLSIETLDASGNLIQSFSTLSSSATIVSGLDSVVANRDTGTTTDPKILDSHGNFMRYIAPSLFAADNSSVPNYTGKNPYPSMDDYLGAVSGQTVNIVGLYDGVSAENGTPHPAAKYDYSGALNNSSGASGDNTPITLSGTLSTKSGGTFPKPSAGPDIVIKPWAGNGGDALAQNIYEVGINFTAGGESHNIGDNTVYASIVRDLLTGFDAGFIGRFTTSSDNLPSNEWWGNTPFVSFDTSKVYYNPYAKVIQENSQAYGFAFSDRLRTQLADLNAQTSTLVVTILPDDFLSSPKNLTATLGADNEVTLDWDQVSQADGYEVYYRPPLEGTVVDIDSNTTTTKVTQLDSGTPYSFTCRAYVNDSGTKLYSPWSNTATVTTSGSRSKNTGDALWYANLTFDSGFWLAGDTVEINGVTCEIVEVAGTGGGDPSYQAHFVTYSPQVPAGSSGVKDDNFSQYGGDGYPGSLTDPYNVKINGEGRGFVVKGIVTTATGSSNYTQVTGVQTGVPGIFYPAPATEGELFDVDLPAPTDPVSGHTAEGATLSFTTVAQNPVAQIPVFATAKSTNTYVLTWRRAPASGQQEGDIVFQNVFYVTLGDKVTGDNPLGVAKIQTSASQTFLQGVTQSPSYANQPDGWVTLNVFMPANYIPPSGD